MGSKNLFGRFFNSFRLLVLYVESGDILALLAGIAIVIIVAVVANPPDLSGIPFSAGVGVQPTETNTRPAASGTAPPFTLTQTPGGILSKTNKSDSPPYRIFYTDKPFTYPV